MAENRPRSRNRRQAAASGRASLRGTECAFSFTDASRQGEPDSIDTRTRGSGVKGPAILGGRAHSCRRGRKTWSGRSRLAA